MCPHFGLQAFIKVMDILLVIIASVFCFRSFSLDVYYIDSSPREPRFVLVPLRFASEASGRPRASAGLGEPRSASNATNLLHHGLKQGRKSVQNMLR